MILKDLRISSFIQIVILLVNAFALDWLIQYVTLGSPFFLIRGLLFLIPLFFFKNIRLILNIIGLLLSFALPVAKVIGSGLFQAAALEVLLSTNFDEALEFHSVLPLKLILLAIVFASLFIALIVFNRRLLYIKKKAVLLTAAAITLILGINCSIKALPIYQERFTDIVSAYYVMTDTSAPPQSDFIIQKNQNKRYHTYVVIVGESMRSDFMSLTGFPEKTTPNLDEMPLWAIDGMISPAPNTGYSVPRFLSKTVDGTMQDNNNAVILAKLSGYTTYWISAHGYTGESCFPAARIARYADKQHISPRPDDFALLKSFEKALEDPSDKVIFLHIVGSHENPCSRLFDYRMMYNLKGGKVLNCYLSTYNKTDELIKQVVDDLKKYSPNSYSLAYFADHGLNFVNDGDDYAVFRNADIKEQYKVPFLMISSDIKDHRVLKAQRSGFNFIDFFASWIGSNTNLTIDNFDMFREESDDVKVTKYTHELTPYKDLLEGLTAAEIYEKIK